MDSKELGKRLRTAREYLGFTQQDVADALGLHRPSVSEIEAGRRGVSSEELVKLSRLYKQPVGYLLGEEPVEIPAQVALMTEGLDEEDRAELVRFAEYLTWRKRFKES